MLNSSTIIIIGLLHLPQNFVFSKDKNSIPRDARDQHLPLSFPQEFISPWKEQVISPFFDYLLETYSMSSSTRALNQPNSPLYSLLSISVLTTTTSTTLKTHFNLYISSNTLNNQQKKGIKCHSSTEFTTYITLSCSSIHRNPTEPILRYYMTTRDYQQLLHYLNENQCPSSSYYYLEINKNV